MKTRLNINISIQIISILLISLGITIFVNLSSITKATVDENVDKNWRTSYDILVRPAKSDPFLDFTGKRLIEPNFLSGQNGGITLEQYQSIQSIPGIEVAAPIAMVGYFPLGFITSTPEVMDQPTAPWAIYKDVRTVAINDGLREFKAQDTLYTINDRRDSFGIDPKRGEGGVLITPDGETYTIDNMLNFSIRDISPTQVRLLGKELSVSKDGKPSGHSYNDRIDLYMLLAGIDPAQEQALVGLENATTMGRYLNKDDFPKFKNTISWSIPILSNRNTYRDLKIEDVTYGLTVPLEDNLPEKLQNGGLDYLNGLEERVLQNESFFSLLDSFPSAVERSIKNNSAIGGLDGLFTTYVLPNPVTYAIGDEQPGFPLSLEAQPIGISERSPIPSSPLNPMEVSFRKESTQPMGYKGDGEFSGSNYGVMLIPVGSFTLGGLPSNPLNEVPMESYTPPSAILRFDEQKVAQEPITLRPTNNPLGYLSDPPSAFTTLESARFLAQRDDFISAIRIRVSGVEKVNEQSQEKIENMAAEIKNRTGLQVDITLGSSPQPVLVHLPGIQNLPGYGYVEEHWIRQLVGITIHRGVNQADLFFFASLLISCCMYVVSNATFTILNKRKEIGIFGAVGWRPSNIFVSLLKDTAVMSGFAIMVSFLLSGVFIVTGLAEYSTVQVLLAVPIIMVVFIAGTAYTAWRAVVETPIDAISGDDLFTKAPESMIARRFWNLKRLIPAWLAMSMSMGSFILVVAISYQLKGLMVGSLLGELISIQFQPYHYVLLAIGLLISGFCIMESLLTRLIERRSEIGLLKAVGWQNKAVFNHFMNEGLTLSLISGVTGTILGLGIFRGFYSSLPQSLVLLLILGLVLPVLVGSLASIYPAYQATHFDPIDILNSK
ncbi:MAG: ABC transporter permease [Anaerolineaceae bacterium]|nr:ABC transporter permease [Anaerolineaceae bacterium]